MWDMGIDINNYQGQCYDNVANVSGTYKGLQTHIKEQNPFAEWVPCAAITLKLVGVNSVATVALRWRNSLVSFRRFSISAQNRHLVGKLL